MVFDYSKIKKVGIAHSVEGSYTVMAIDVVKFTSLGDNDSFRDAVKAAKRLRCTGVTHFAYPSGQPRATHP